MPALPAPSAPLIRHRMWQFVVLAEVALPCRCTLVEIELFDDTVGMPSFRHPLNTAYLFGPGRGGCPAGLLD
jgi:hypothetical protein